MTRGKVNRATLWKDAQKRAVEQQRQEELAVWAKASLDKHLGPYRGAVEAEKNLVSLMLTPDERKALAQLSPETAYVMGVSVNTKRRK